MNRDLVEKTKTWLEQYLPTTLQKPPGYTTVRVRHGLGLGKTFLPGICGKIQQTKVSARAAAAQRALSKRARLEAAQALLDLSIGR